MKIKQKFADIREKKLYIRYLIMLAVNIVFFALLSIPCMNSYGDGNAREIVRVAIYLILFVFSLIYGFISVEITDNIFYANIAFAFFGGLFGAFTGNSLLEISDYGNYADCVIFFIRYSVMSFFVSLIIKNTRR